MKPLRQPPGLMRLQTLTDRKIPALPITDEQRNVLHSVVNRAAAGNSTALRFDSLGSLETFLRHLVHNTPRPLSFSFERTEITAFVEDDDDSVLGFLALTTESTGVGKRSADLRQATRIQEGLSDARV
jgi:hypothetical protein